MAEVANNNVNNINRAVIQPDIGVLAPCWALTALRAKPPTKTLPE